jgi:hypothetical protein
MSRYDRGLEHPGIDRLRARIGAAREVVLTHPVYRRPDTMQTVADRCGADESRWAECSATINTALEARVRLWDGIVPALDDQPLAG